jgi:ABC-type transport system involved in multi-copper enzyme maturation permease subunit
MISRVSAITVNTFREAVRDRVLYNLVVFVLLLVASAPLFSVISIGIERLVLVNVGLSSISFFGVVIAILIGVGLVSKEIEKKTLYTILSRPVRRWEFIAGKYGGLMMTLTVNTGLMAVGLYLALFINQHKLTAADGNLVVAIYFILLSLSMVTALTLLFSSFSTPIFSAVFSFALFLIGNFADDLRSLATSSHTPLKPVLTAMAYAVPDFSTLNVISLVAHEEAIKGSLVVFSTIYALLYSVSILTAAVLVFEHRNLK